MQKELEYLSKEFADKPIYVPGSPFWNVFKDFGKDELIALIINVLGTIVFGFFTKNVFILSFAGPIIEKVGFFPAHFKEALNIYKTTPLKQRKKLQWYLKRAFKNSSTNLSKDVFLHDPLYIFFMFLGFSLYSGIPVWLLSLSSFLIAIALVSLVEVIYKEVKYLNFKRRMVKKGFEVESYYESRFLISAKEDPQKIIKKAIQTFKLNKHKELRYKDLYFENDLWEFSGRTPQIRLRERYGKEERFQSVQIVYTRASELLEKKYEQYRFFPIKKDKIYFVLKGKMPKELKDIKMEGVRRFLTKHGKDKDKSNIYFNRVLAYNKDIFFSADLVDHKNKFFIVEIKSHTNLPMLFKAMRFIMREFSVVQTTRGKSDIAG